MNVLTVSLLTQVKKAAEQRQTSCTDLMRAYQFCLQYLTKRAEEISGVIGLCNEVEVLWFSYLESWRKSGKQISCYFVKDKDAPNPKKRANKSEDSSDSDSDSDTEIDPLSEEDGVLAPTRPLMLGFIYFAARTLRSWIVPSNIVIWIQQGHLPYSNLMEIMPENIKSPILGYCNYVFIAERHKKGFPTPVNILYHTVEIGRLLGRRLSPLNTVLVAHAFIHNLGFPHKVWRNYVLLRSVIDGQ